MKDIHQHLVAFEDHLLDPPQPMCELALDASLAVAHGGDPHRMSDPLEEGSTLWHESTRALEDNGREVSSPNVGSIKSKCILGVAFLEGDR